MGRAHLRADDRDEELLEERRGPEVRSLVPGPADEEIDPVVQEGLHPRPVPRGDQGQHLLEEGRLVDRHHHCALQAAEPGQGIPPHAPAAGEQKLVLGGQRLPPVPGLATDLQVRGGRRDQQVAEGDQIVGGLHQVLGAARRQIVVHEGHGIAVGPVVGLIEGHGQGSGGGEVLLVEHGIPTAGGRLDPLARFHPLAESHRQTRGIVVPDLVPVRPEKGQVHDRVQAHLQLRFDG